MKSISIALTLLVWVPVCASGQVIKATDPSAAGGKGSIPGEAGTYSLDNTSFVSCPTESFVTGIQGFKPNGGSPIYQIRYNCKTTGGVETAIRGTDPSVANGKGSVAGLEGTYGLDNLDIVSCPSGSFVSAIQGFKPNGRNYVVHIRYECRTLAGVETAIKGTDPEVAGSKGSVEDLAGTYSLESNVAECPPGTFASAIQGFKPNGAPQIVDIRYLCASAPAVSKPTAQAPAVLVSFEGGVIGDNVSSVLDAIARQPGALPTETYTAKRGDTLCGILESRNFPPCTKKLEASVDRLNPSLLPARRGINEGDTLVLPKVAFKAYRARASFSNSDPATPGVAAGIQRHWLNAHALPVPPTRTVIEYLAYDMYIDAKDDLDALSLAKLVRPLESYNVSVDVLRTTSTDSGKVNTVLENSEVMSECSDNTITGKTYSYVDLADSDTDALGVVRQELASSPRAVNVFLIDVPLQVSPNLGDADGKPSWQCHWQPTFNDSYHATHIAGIIASKGFGFEGLARNAELQSFVWDTYNSTTNTVVLAPESDRIRLADIINDHVPDKPIPVYLAATRFPPPDGVVDGTILQAQKRFTGKVANIIWKGHPLLIVAAGQDPPHDPHELNDTTAFSPQYFGDLENVVVVTACEVCRRDDTKIMKSANYGRNFVHVAAPGGDDVPGWLSPTEIGLGRGTSQAAAYVAGIAARMIGNFPDAFSSAMIVKLRLQVASRPLPLEVGPTESLDQMKLSAGVVDPILSLLNPAKTWVKTAAGWGEMRIKSWPKAGLDVVDPLGKTYHFKGNEILRLLNMQAPGGTRYWSLYIDESKHGENVNLGTVRRVGPVTITGSPAFTLCDGSSMNVDAVVDLIAPLGGVFTDACPNS